MNIGMAIAADHVLDDIRDKIFGDTSGSREDNIEALRLIQEEIGIMIQTLEADIETQE